jgi:hypothetical protein
MKKSIALIIAASTLFLAGCCTPHRATQWEYKTDRQAISARDLGSHLSQLGADGWQVDKVITPANDMGYATFLLKRPKQ